VIDGISCIGDILEFIYSLIMNISGELSAASSPTGKRDELPDSWCDFEA